MSKLKSHYFAGAVATAIGTTPVTLRMWRDRGICDLGSVEEGAEDNPRARRRYSLLEAGQMGVAVYLSRFGWSLEEAFNLVTGDDKIKAAIVSVVLDAEASDTIISMVDENRSAEEGYGWRNLVILSKDEWVANAASAFDAVDFLTKAPVDGFFSFNVSSISRRVIAALKAIADESEA